MWNRMLGVGIVAVLAWAGLARADGTTPPVPTTPEIQAMVKDGKYADALKAIVQVLPTLSSEKAPSTKLYAVYMLRGEANLQLKQGTEATDAYTAAKGQAAKAKDAALPVAMALLIKRSTAFAYTPQATADKVNAIPKAPGQPTPATQPGTQPATQPNNGPPPAGKALNIIDAKERKTALLGLFYDELVNDQSTYNTAKSATTLQPVEDFALTMGTLHLLELAATGADTMYTAAMDQTLLTHAENLMTQNLTQLTNQETTINTQANGSVPVQVQVPGTGSGRTARPATTITEYHKQGLTTDQTTALNGILTTLAKYPDAAKSITDGLAADPQSFKSILAQADALKKKTTATLNADYTKVTKTAR